MKVASIVPCIRVTKENYMIGFNMYIEEGDIIEVIDNDKNVFSGAFKCLKLDADGEEGIYNPRLNHVYLLEINSINSEIIEEVSSAVIGYW